MAGVDPLPLIPPRSLARTAERIATALFSLGIAAVSVGTGILFAVAPFNPPAPGAWRLGPVLACFAAGGLVSILCWREARASYGWAGSLAGFALTIRRGGRRTTLDLRTLDRALWPPAAGGAVTLAGPGGRVRIAPAALEPAARLAFVRRVRAAAPTDVQTGWPRYCRVAALPSVRCELPTRPLRPGERVETEPFSPGLTIVCVALGEVGGWLCWWLTGEAIHLILGPATGLIFSALRRAANRSHRPVILPPPDESPAERDARAAAEWDALGLEYALHHFVAAASSS